MSFSARNVERNAERERRPSAPYLTLLLLLGVAPLRAEEAWITETTRQALKTWAVPGAAVVIVRDDRIVYCRGHGVRQVRRDDPVTDQTLFPLSSCSKGFTTAAMALLRAEGKLDWDDPVRTHLPWFRLADPLVEREIRLRDLVCHRSGLSAHELLWHHAPWPPEEAVRRLRFLPLDRPFRTSLQYQSTMFTAAGLAAARAAGTSWSELVRQRLLDPLGMKDTGLSYAEIQKSPLLASPHQLDRAGAPERLPHLDSPHPDPAISVYSTARDLGAWLRYQLTSPTAAETHWPQMVITLSPAQRVVFPRSTQVSYAMGWVVHDHEGIGLVSHGGAIDGFRCHFALAPKQKVGVAVVCNLQGTPMPLALANTLLDRLLGLPQRDWNALHAKLRATLQEEADEKRRQLLTGRRHGTTPSRELGAYAGEYRHPAYGMARIQVRRGGLVWRWRDEEVPLTHFHHDTYHLHSDLLDEAALTFALDSSGAVREVAVGGRLGVTFRKGDPPRQPR